METFINLWQIGIMGGLAIIIITFCYLILSKNTANEQRLLRVKKLVEKKKWFKAQKKLERICIRSLTEEEYLEFKRLTLRIDKEIYEEYGDLPMEEK